MVMIARLGLRGRLRCEGGDQRQPAHEHPSFRRPRRTFDSAFPNDRRRTPGGAPFANATSCTARRPLRPEQTLLHALVRENLTALFGHDRVVALL